MSSNSLNMLIWPCAWSCCLPSPKCTTCQRHGKTHPRSQCQTLHRMSPPVLTNSWIKNTEQKLFSDNHQSCELCSWFRANPPCQMGFLKPIFCSLVCWWLGGGYTYTTSTGLTGRGNSFQAIPQCASLLINIFICLPLTSKLLLMRRWGILKFPRTKLAIPIQSTLAGLMLYCPQGC